MVSSQKSGNSNDQQPDQWQKDLNPNPMAGQNIGVEANEIDRYDQTAEDLKELHDRLDQFTNAELKQIPILKTGTRLKQGAVYIDLNDPSRQEFTAMGDMSAEKDNLFVPKSEVGYMLWNRLIGVENPERLDQSS
ncbi:hypothetical protein Sta7437_3373 [Stanieria cyanosphaera PCC 7437]|uniref:Uncharacterized protein n=1 Tax=Stanieria cyanosphaera (strain ATCC 29371 / PCC 7437) TaxID=111780 RepID=K9XXU5_STAC7|nr:hypothetical protein [Stanieria cyanosphaera]AFZ36879.1 hypothetical protein Sta7437_3373 [Stanieria cyanosphaera PCC 7437]